jgi:SAM-dependent methyltransferase
MKVKVVTQTWLKNILCDPISKNSLELVDESYYLNKEGFAYSIRKQVPDLRIRLSQSEHEWLEGQEEFEKWMISYLDNAEKNKLFYSIEQKADSKMYERLQLEGRVLDVGGQLGHIRKYMKENQEYCSIDPFVNVVGLVDGKENLFNHYPLSTPLNFIGGYAEFLPFKSMVFDTVNMRSCIDHFFNPELSLLEANRVLNINGKLIIGMTVEVRSFKFVLKESLRAVLGVFTKKYRDHHIWHPTRESIIRMCKTCGFELEDEVWQSENIWYSSFRKNKSTIFVT